MRSGLGVFLTVFIFFNSVSFAQKGFKTSQLQFSTVKTAYKEKQNLIAEKLKVHEILFDEMEVYLRIFKKEQELEVWAKSILDSVFVQIEKFKICYSSGTIGPKRRRHDLQVPEGFYSISNFNPSSSYYLSLGVNYPNKSDRILGEKNNLGGNIAIHGSCISVGCVPITDDFMKSLYIYCVEAKNNGQFEIPITIFPCRFNALNIEMLNNLKEVESSTQNLWATLKEFDNRFNQDFKLSRIKTLSDGSQQVY